MAQQECCKIIGMIGERLVDAIWAAQGDGWTTQKGAEELIVQIERAYATCGFKPAWPIIGRPPLYEYIGSKKHKLVGFEEDKNKADDWATNMREHSGEKIVVKPFLNGFAIYRLE